MTDDEMERGVEAIERIQQEHTERIKKRLREGVDPIDILIGAHGAVEILAIVAMGSRAAGVAFLRRQADALERRIEEREQGGGE